MLNKKLKRSILLLTTILMFTSAGIAQAASSKQLSNLEEELINLGDIYRVVATDKKMATKAAITFHANLMESEKNNNLHIMSLTWQEVQQLKDFGFKVKAYPEWKQKYKNKRLEMLEIQNLRAAADMTTEAIPGYSCYPTVEETFAQAQSLASANPSLASWIDIGDSWEKTTANGGYDLMVLKVSNQAVTADKPKLFIHSAMHAREYTTAALTLEFATQLINSYGSNADMTWIVDHHEIHFLFHMNPDGRKQAESGISWRKNTNQNYCGATSTSRGADLNRNFSHFWDVTNGSGSSGNVCASTYRGPSEASEPETAAVETYIRSLFPDMRGPNESDAAPLNTQGMHLDIHSYSELVLWPYGHTSTSAPNGNELQTLGRKLAYWNAYTPQQSIGLYPTDGTSESISYGELGLPNFTYELGTAFFQSCSVYENTIKPNNLPSLLYAAKIIRAPYQTPAGPEVHSLSLDGQANTSVIIGSQVSIAALADDGRYENSNGVEASQNVTQAEYYIDTPPWVTGAIAIAMQASDGSFNNSSENISATIDTSLLSEGQHTVFTRAKDANGQWGAVSAAFLTVGPDISGPPSAEFTSNCNELNCTFDASASSDVGSGSIISYAWNYGDGVTGLGVSSAHSYTAAGDYTVTLTVTDNDNETDVASNLVTVTVAPPSPPAAPANLVANVVKQGKGKKATIISVDLSWTDNADNEDGFIIERCIESGKGKNKVCNFATYASVGANTTAYSDPSPASNTKYRVKAFNAAGESAYSNEVKP